MERGPKQARTRAEPRYSRGGLIDGSRGPLRCPPKRTTQVQTEAIATPAPNSPLGRCETEAALPRETAGCQLVEESCSDLRTRRFMNHDESRCRRPSPRSATQDRDTLDPRVRHAAKEQAYGSRDLRFLPTKHLRKAKPRCARQAYRQQSPLSHRHQLTRLEAAWRGGPDLQENSRALRCKVVEEGGTNPTPPRPPARAHAHHDVIQDIASHRARR